MGASKPVLTRLCDSVFAAIGSSRNTGKIQANLIVINFVASLWPAACYVLYSSDVHVSLWLGDEMQYLGLAIPLALLCLNLFLLVLRCSPNAKPKSVRSACLGVFLFLGLVLVGVGLFALAQAGEISVSLRNSCGVTQLQGALHTEWVAASNYLRMCDPANAGVEVVRCPGYAQLPLDWELQAYADKAEADFSCCGFCQADDRPLFNVEADCNVVCSREIASHLSATGYLVGLPPVIAGGALVGVGMATKNYKHL